jgi:ABC-type Fe3+/spermidine/putrescine transport system ATPase subunit
MTQLSIRGLTKTWPGAAAPALDRLTLDVAAGEMVALLGPSGCGKTTALQMIAGLLEPTAGDITIDGRSILADPPQRRGVVMMFQNALLFPHMSVVDNVGFGLRMRGLSRDKVAARVAQMLARVQLPDLGARKPSQLSGGQQQRVALARALIVSPRVLLLDEPLSNLDAHLRAEMRDLIRSLQRELAITTIVVTHEQEEAVVLADRVALILDGRLRQVDPAEAFYRRPADQAVARFFGGQNFVTGQAQGGLSLPTGIADGPGILTIRPEAIRLGLGDNALSVSVVDQQFLGTQTRLAVQAGPARLVAILPPDAVAGINAGDMITIHLPQASLWVLPDA